jgi:predicted DNA-binding transcriptional regulator YafY
METGLNHQYLALIDKAIKSQRVIQIRYRNNWRTVEPYLAGIHQEEKTASLYCYCRDVIPGQQSGESRWQIFTLDEIEAIELTLYQFEKHVHHKRQLKQVKPLMLTLIAHESRDNTCLA